MYSTDPTWPPYGHALYCNTGHDIADCGCPCHRYNRPAPARHDRAGAAAVAFALGVTSLLLWPLGPLACGLALAALRGRPPVRGRHRQIALAGLTLGGVGSAILVLVLVGALLQPRP